MPCCLVVWFLLVAVTDLQGFSLLTAEEVVLVHGFRELLRCVSVRWRLACLPWLTVPECRPRLDEEPAT